MRHIFSTGNDEAINSKEGEGKAEYVDKVHPQEHDKNSQAGMVDIGGPSGAKIYRVSAIYTSENTAMSLPVVV